MKVPVLKLNEATQNGRIYPDYVVADSVANAQLPLFGTFGCTGKVHLELGEVSHRVSELKIENDQLVANVEILNTPRGTVLSKALSQNQDIKFHAVGTGMVDDDGVVSEYSLISVSVTMI